MNRVSRFDARTQTIALSRGLEATITPVQADPTTPVDGVNIGIATMSENSPHAGEMHAGGDETLYLISGKARVVFLDGDEEDIELNAGDGLIVPKGIWHRVDILKPCQIVYVTPGLDNAYRPLE